MRILAAGLALVLGAAAPAGAQRLDPDWCLTCRDSREHFVAGAGIDVGLRALFPRTRVWHRVALTCLVGAAYEAGQESATHDGGRTGPGFGFGPKDLLLDCAGAAAAEGLVALGRRVLR